MKYQINNNYHLLNKNDENKILNKLKKIEDTLLHMLIKWFAEIR